MASQESRVLRLLEPQGEPDIIECDGKLYVPDKECEFMPEWFYGVWDDELQHERVTKPSDDCSYFSCDECGFELRFDWDGDLTWFEPKYPYKPIGLKYCPGCGARVLFPPSWVQEIKEEDE